MSLRALQLTLAATAAAAAVVMAGLLPAWARLACLGVILAGAAATAPERTRRGGGWWLLVAVGALLSVGDFAVAELSEPAETIAGAIAIAGAALVIAGAVIGFPLAA